MPGDQETERRSGAVGPVQTAGEAGTPGLPPPPETAVVASPGAAYERRIQDWWSRLGVRRRRLGLVLGAVLVLGLIWGAAQLVRPGGAPSAPLPPVPYPAQVADVRYAGTTATGAANRFTVQLTVTNTSGTVLTLEHVAQPYRGVSVTTAQQLPLQLFPARPQPVWVEMTVQNCSLTPRADSLPFIDVTLSNARAIQTQSEILGTDYALDLNAAILKACPS